MFNLLRSMAITNLRKNRALYVPFALATVMVTVVLGVTNALGCNAQSSLILEGWVSDGQNT